MPDITIAPDGIFTNNGGERHGIVWTDSLTGYYAYIDDTAPSLYRYRKTVNGSTFGLPVTINTLALEPGTAQTVYYEPYTSGISTKLIHFVWTQFNAVVHRSLDPTTDTFSAVHTIIAPGSAQAIKVGLGQARAGDLWVWWASADGLLLNDVRRSTNQGVTWADPGPNPIESAADDVLIMPASNTGDDRDMWFLYHDGSTDETSLKFWDASAVTFTEALITGGITWGAGQTQSRWRAGQWHDATGHLSLIQWTSSAGARDLQCWEINSAISFTQRTNLQTASAVGQRAVVTLSQVDGRLYAAWADGNAGSVDYKTSLDRGATWDALTEFSDGNPGAVTSIYAAMSIRNGDTGRWMPAWFENVATAHESNFDNSIVLGLPAPGPPVPPPPIVPGGGTYGDAPGAPPGTILYITPDGIQYPLVTPHVTGRFVMSFSGFGTAPIQYISQRGPNQDGESVRDFNLTPRVIQLLERQQFKSRGAWWDGRADILNDLRPNRQLTATAVVTGTVRIVTANGDVRDLNVFIQDGPRFEARNVDEWDEWAFEEVLRFIAHDPLWFNPTRVDFALAFTLASHLIFPVTLPPSMQFGPGDIDQSFNLDYTGTWASLPTIVITGPLDNPIIDNVTTGETLALLRNIGPGRTVTIDLAFGQKTIVDDLGTNLLGSLSTDSDLGTWHIAPTPEAPQVAGQPRPTARNVIRLRGSNPTGSTSVEVRYFTRYFGI